MRLLFLSLLSVFMALPCSALDFEGRQFRMVWDESTGEPEGYRVWINRDGAGFSEECIVAKPSTIVVGELGQIIEVKVKAYRGTAESGFSPPSDSVRIVSPPPSAPGTLQIQCVDPGERLTETSPGRFRCEPTPIAP